MVDIAESALLKNVLAGDNCAIIFTLKTIGKSRGYVERQEIVGDLSHKFNDMSDDDLAKRLAELQSVDD